jgi:cytochrome P450
MDTRLPPGPRGYAGLGLLSAGLVPAASVLLRLRDEYGDTFRVRYPSGPITFTGDPEVLRALYGADPDAFDVFGIDATAPVFGTASVAVTSGAKHRRDRKLLAPAFNGSVVRDYGPVIRSIAARAASEWPVGREFPMLAAMQEITLEIIIRLVFGIQSDARIRRTRHAVLELIASLHPALFFFPPLRHDFGGIGPWARNRRAVAALNAILAEEIEERSRTPREAQDILGRMMAARDESGAPMDRDELLDQLRALLFAGHETTATVLAWAMYWLFRREDVRTRVLQELDALGPRHEPNAVLALPYLDCVCLETLRLYPPVVDPARVTRAPFEIAGYVIPAGEAIRPAPMLLHTRADLYPDPFAFCPERFLDRKFSAFEFAPFGGGARRCIGAALALTEMKIVLTTILSTQQLRLTSTGAVVHARRGLTLGPEGGVPFVCAGPRRAPAALEASP